ncbi:uncharacterized protein LOC129250760 [Anastrepha obliqua]|uniref:uncharacterized protein LOC129250760 n=1 Tax=Anastrepha obliqua TaxID=95512 RepID=UPI0024092EC7|nr:uncharacterized protein LOC129250760 [Anastrepha obliqua]
MSYKDAACSTKLGIIPPDYPATIWPTDKLRAIQHAILDSIRKKQTGGAKPIFNSCTFRAGYIVVSCGNDETTDWLKAAMPKLEPWKDAQIKIVLEKDIPRPLIFTCHFPELDSTSTEDILNLLDGQNSGLNVQEWRVLRRVQKGKVTELTIAIDPISAIVIKKHHYWLNYGFSTVQLRTKAKTPEKDAEPEVPKPPALQRTEEQPCTSASAIAATAVSVTQTDEQPCCSKDAPHATKPAPMSSAQRVEEGIRMRK